MIALVSAPFPYPYPYLARIYDAVLPSSLDASFYLIQAMLRILDRAMYRVHSISWEVVGCVDGERVIVSEMIEGIMIEMQRIRKKRIASESVTLSGSGRESAIGRQLQVPCRTRSSSARSLRDRTLIHLSNLIIPSQILERTPQPSIQLMSKLLSPPRILFTI
jgi:hypothetical protein